MEPCPLAHAAGWPLLPRQMWGGVGRAGIEYRAGCRANASQSWGFWEAFSTKGRMLWRLPGLGTAHCPPWKEQKGKGTPFVGSQGSDCLFPRLLDALLQPDFYRGLASPIVSALQESSSQEALNNFNFQKVGKKEQQEGPEKRAEGKGLRQSVARSKAGRPGVGDGREGGKTSPLRRKRKEENGKGPLIFSELMRARGEATT